MKKILILTRIDKPEYDPFIENGKKQNLEIILANHKDIILEQKQKNKITINDHNLKDFSLIYFKSLVKDIHTQAITIQLAKLEKIKIVDKIFEKQNYFVENKAFDFIKLSNANLPIIESVFCNFDIFKQKYFNHKFPLILKKVDGAQGKNVHICNSQQEIKFIFEKYENKKLLIQPFIPNDGDLRILVIGKRVIGSMKRQTSNKDEFRNNVSLGGTASVHNATQEQIELAINATKILNYDVAGVDLIFDSKQKTWKIMEVNRAPQFTGFMKATNINVYKEIISYLKSQI